jgi:NADPH:quinone reductase
MGAISLWIACRAVRALQLTELSGPDGLELSELPEPEATHMLTPGEGVVVDVKAAAVSFPDVLQTRGLYQYKPDLPFVPGAEVGGVVRSAPASSGLSAGDRVAAFTAMGGMAESAVAPAFMTFPLPESLDFAQGAALVLNYHTAYFALKLRGRLVEGERVLVHGAAGGVGTAALQVAKGLGASTVAVVSSDEKERVAREAGADDVVRSDGPWREQAVELTGGGVDVVLDPVGGDRFTDSLRSLREDGRVVVVGFTGGSIPEVKVNRLLLRNTAVIGAGWGGYVMGKPALNREIGGALDEMIAAGTVRPLIGQRFPLARGADAFRVIDERQATGKVVLDVPGD